MSNKASGGRDGGLSGANGWFVVVALARRERRIGRGEQQGAQALGELAHHWQLGDEAETSPPPPGVLLGRVLGTGTCSTRFSTHWEGESKRAKSTAEQSASCVLKPTFPPPLFPRLSSHYHPPHRS